MAFGFPSFGAQPCMSDRCPPAEPPAIPNRFGSTPYRQESTGLWLSSEGQAERHVDEVGLTDRDRVEREPTVGKH